MVDFRFPKAEDRYVWAQAVHQAIHPSIASGRDEAGELTAEFAQALAKVGPLPLSGSADLSFFVRAWCS